MLNIYFLLGWIFFLPMWPYFPHHSIALFFGFVWLEFAFILTAVAKSGEAYANNMATMINMIENYHIEDAQMTVQNDRDIILKSIKEMYPKGGVDEFDNKIHTEIYQVVMREFKMQRSPFSYRNSMLAGFPTTVAYISFV